MVGACEQGQHCGLADPVTIHERGLLAKPRVSSVAYMRHGVDANGRRLGIVSESYATTGLTYMNIDDAMANGVAKKVMPPTNHLTFIGGS